MSSVGREADGGRGENHETTVEFSWNDADEDASRGVRRAIGPGMTRAAPEGRPIWRAAVSQLLLADELHPEARRAKDRPGGLAHLVLLVSHVAHVCAAIGAGLYAVADRRVKPRLAEEPIHRALAVAGAVIPGYPCRAASSQQGGVPGLYRRHRGGDCFRAVSCWLSITPEERHCRPRNPSHWPHPSQRPTSS